ncbi:MAG: N-acetyltransferase O1 (Establishment of cohesion protein 1) [Stictis urceolatum]|nr:N-acetyltransferase O1 (Establishment of cohesion protein 1) [Stictis urceolata]
MRTYGGHRPLNRSLLDTMNTASSDKPRIRISMDENGRVKEETTYPGSIRAIDTTASHYPHPTTSNHHAPHSSNSAEPSSPISRAIFSEPSNSERTHPTSASPPSSPPPAPQAQHPPKPHSQPQSESKRASSPPLKTRKPTFSFLKRKRSIPTDAPTDAPLSETTANTPRRFSPSHPPAKRTRLTQMQLDLGGSTQRTCRDCGMEYVPSSREDAKLHGEFHAKNLGGVDMGAGFAKETRVVERWGFGEVVSCVEGLSAVWVQKRVGRVMDVVRADLGSAEIPEEEMWGRRKGGDKNRGEREGKEEEGEEGQEQRYKVFLYLAGDKCVGLCLAERIRHAEKVLKREEEKGEEIRPGARSSCVRTETSIEPMLLGISRVWVSKSHRRKGIAQTLLDSARNNFFFGIQVPKKMVAFSQPTESGGYLAESWYGEEAGWHVYRESN